MDYGKIIADCLSEMEKPLPRTCHERGWPATDACRRAGGCPVCYAELLGKSKAAGIAKAGGK